VELFVGTKSSNSTIRFEKSAGMSLFGICIGDLKGGTGILACKLWDATDEHDVEGIGTPDVEAEAMEVCKVHGSARC
jgi:hypothetical protein